MPNIDKVIDSQSLILTKNWEKVLLSVAQEVKRLSDQGLDTLTILGKLNIERVVFNSGMETAINAVDYPKILSSLKGFGNATPEQLEAATNLSKQTLSSYFKGATGALTEQLQSLDFTALNIADIRAALLNTQGLRPDQIETLVNTTLNTYSRVVTDVMSQGLPDNALYIYQGPADSKTRDICLEMIAAGPLTKSEIRSRFPGSFIDGGGFNCRHRWTQLTKNFENKNNEVKAKTEIAIKEATGKWKTPQTPLQVKLDQSKK